MDFYNICRTCLSRNNLNPIYTNVINNAINLDIIYAATGVKIKINDGLPQNICSYCIKTVQHILEFRKKCIDAETELISIKKETYNKSDFDIQTKDEEIQSVTLKDSCDKSDIDIETKEKEIQSVTLKESYDKSDIDIETKDEDIQSVTLKDINKENHNINEESENPKEIKNEPESDFEDDDDKPLTFLKENPHKSNQIKVTNVLYDINDNSSRITCKLCQKNLSKRSINMHMARHHPGADDTRVKCELCNDYILKDNLNRHLETLHGTDSFKCRYCKKEHKNKESLTKHITNCTVKKKRKTCKSSRELTECDVCNKKMQKASLRMHKAIKHAGLGPVCEYCGKRFGNKFRLNEHYRAKHGHEKFKCSYCDFQSAAVVAMRNHERRHRGEKPFVCESCGAKFHAAYLLAQHKHSHRTDKIFKCPQCPAAFKAGNSLHAHRRACHDVARVRCAVCARAFRCRLYAVKHMRAVHRHRGPVPPLAPV